MITPTPVHNELHRIATTAIIWKEEGGERRYLITKRAPHKKVWPNKWTVPGGGLEVTDYINSDDVVYQNSESPQWYNVVEKALLREIKEEVGVTVGEFLPMGDVAFIRPDGVPVIVFRYCGKYEGGEVVLDEDATEYAWILASEAEHYDFIQGIEKEIQDTEKLLSET